MRKSLLALLLVHCILFAGYSARSQGDWGIYLKTMTIVPEPNAGEGLSKILPEDQRSSFQSRIFRIVQFTRIPGQEEKEILKNAGVELMDYLPELAYSAAFKEGFDASVINGMPVRSIIEIRPEYKLSPSLYNGNFPVHARGEGGTLRLVVCYFPVLDADAVKASLVSKGIAVTGSDDFGRCVFVEIHESALMYLAEVPFVAYVEPVAAEPVPENSGGRTLHRTSVLAADYSTGRNYDGTGVQVMLQDDGIIGPHIDYQGRIGAQYATNNSGNHGDHCAGIIMAAGNLDPRGKGNAFGSTLWVYSVSPGYPGFSAIPTVYGSPGIRVTSASYGDGCNAGYTSLTRTLDQQVRNFPQLMHVFSAGNDGSSNCGYGAGAGWGNITGGHKQGKNLVAVANLNNQDELSSSSSRGPAHDGRIKPDIAAKGTNVYSTVDPNTYANKSGTSMACPGIAGTLAQLIHAYRTINSGNSPMAGLLKATILNTAEDLGNPGPDFKFGWGRVNALRAVRVFEEARYDSGVATQGSTGTHAIVVPPNTAQLRVMVYWTDYEASVNTAWALVNNLDITLTDPASATWMPWVLNHFPHPDSLNKTAVRGMDNRNNMEQVTLENPAAGSYTLQVNGATVPQGPQTYYIVYEFIPQEVELIYPLGGESLVPGETEIIRWDAYGNTGNFTIEYSADNGLDWDTVTSSCPGNLRYFNWIVPLSSTANGLIRVSRAGMASQSEVPFSILGIPCNLAIDWVCDTALRLSWNGVSGAGSYKVFRLGEKYMDSVGITQLTSMIIRDTNTTGTSWFSVCAVGQNGSTGRRAIAIDKAPGTFNCHPADMMMADAPTAKWGLFQTCMPLNEVCVPVVVRNGGLLTANSLGFSFRLDNGPVVTGSWNGSLMPDSSLTYTFSQPIDLSVPGTHLFEAWVDFSPDQNRANDTIRVPVEVMDGSYFPANGTQTFESWTKCLSAPVCEVYHCPVSDGWLNLADPRHDQHDWRTFSGNTPTSATGPDADHTTGTSAGKYMYLEPSVQCLNKMAALATPCIDLRGSSSASFSLWYHSLGAEMGTFHVDLFNGNCVTEDITVPVEGSIGADWNRMEVDLTPWIGKIIGLRFRGITGCGERGDFAIDDFSVDQVLTSAAEIASAARVVTLSPNPANAAVTVTMGPAGREACRFTLSDMAGRVLIQKVLLPEGGRLSGVVNLQGIPPGAYLVEITSGFGTDYKKLLVR